MNDRDVSTSREEVYHWRSKEMERQRVLEANGVIDAARHAQHGQVASFKKTLGICMVALAAVGAMIAGGLLTQNATILPERAVQVPQEASSHVAAAEQQNMDLAELFDLDNPETVAAEQNRASCPAIRGTAYKSESERSWYLANCSEPEFVVAFLAAPELSGVVTQPAAVISSGPPGVSEGDAIASTVDWITNQQDAVYDVTSESCSASEVGELWLVSCQRSLAGCADEICTSWIAVCVTDVAGTAFASSDC